jgi:hypothetical protein
MPDLQPGLAAMNAPLIRKWKTCRPRQTVGKLGYDLAHRKPTELTPTEFAFSHSRRPPTKRELAPFTTRPSMPIGAGSTSNHSCASSTSAVAGDSCSGSCLLDLSRCSGSAQEGGSPVFEQLPGAQPGDPLAAADPGGCAVDAVLVGENLRPGQHVVRR